MTDLRAGRQVRSPGISRLDWVRAWLGVGAALAVAVCAATGIAGHSGSMIAPLAALLQGLNLTLFRNDSASRKNGRPRFGPNAGGAQGGSGPRLDRAPLIFQMEEMAILMTSLGALVLLGHALKVPIHPLLYVAGTGLIGLGLLCQLFPQLRGPRPRAPKRTIVRPPSEWLN